MMHVAANLAFVLPGVVGGSEEYSVRLLRAVLDHHADEIGLRVVAHDALFDAHPALAGASVSLPGPVALRSYRVMAESALLPRHTRDVEVTHHFGGRLPRRSTRPSVVTIHDIQPLDLPENFSTVKTAFLRRSLPDTAARADVICTPTRWVAERIMERLGVPDDRIRVVGPAVGRRPVPSQRNALGDLLGNRPVVLFPSVSHPHKNHRLLIQAMAIVHERRPDALLVFTGGAGAAAERVATEIQRFDPEGAYIRHLGRVEEHVLMGLQADADVVAFPSRYEGFGLPVLEAMQAGTPVLAADAACLPEVVGEAGRLLPVDDAEAWADAIVALIDDPEERARMAAAGAVRAEGWSAPDAAARLVHAWRDAAS